MTDAAPAPSQALTERMAALLPKAETDPASLLEYARLWMQFLYTGSPQFKKPREAGTGPWVTRLLIEALTAKLAEQDRLREALARLDVHNAEFGLNLDVIYQCNHCGAQTNDLDPADLVHAASCPILQVRAVLTGVQS